MATNILPSGIGDLFQHAVRMDEGLAIYEPWLFRGGFPGEPFSQLLEAGRETAAAFAAARARKATAGQEFTAADEALTAWLAKARLVVMLAYGSKWSESWLATGFTHRGTNVPKRIGARIELCRRVAKFFAQNREYEVAFAGVTAADASAFEKKILAARREVGLAKSDAATKKLLRDAAEKKLRRRMHVVISFLSIPLGKSDPRWLAFGLNQPRPDAPPQPVPQFFPNPEAMTPIEVNFAQIEKGEIESVPAVA